jgi:hypothetical protein
MDRSAAFVVVELPEPRHGPAPTSVELMDFFLPQILAALLILVVVLAIVVVAVTATTALVSKKGDRGDGGQPVDGQPNS